MSEKTEIDWLAVEADYRPGILSNRDIARKHGCTEGGVRRKAKKEGWVKDLSAKIESKADDIVRREAVRTAYADATEADIIDANANKSAGIQIAQCKEVRGIKGIALRLFEELQDQTESVDEYVKLSEILASNNSEAMQRRFNKVADFSGRVDNMKKLTETVKTIIDLERKVNKIDTDPFSDADKKARVILSFE